MEDERTIYHLLSCGKPVIDIEAQGLGLVIIWPTGVHYANQSGGYSCLLSHAEGVYVALNSHRLDVMKQVEEHFTGGKWNGGCANGIDVETADFLDNALQEMGIRYVKVDRSRLQGSHEAWVYVTLVEPPKMWINTSLVSDGGVSFGLLNGFGQCQGVLTWPNSD